MAKDIGSKSLDVLAAPELAGPAASAIVDLAPRSRDRHLHHLAIGIFDPRNTGGYAGFWRMANDVSINGEARQCRSSVWVDPGALLVDLVGEEIDLWAEYEILNGMDRQEFADTYLAPIAFAFDENVAKAGLAKRLELKARLAGLQWRSTVQGPSDTDHARLIFINELRQLRRARGDARVPPDITSNALHESVREVWAGLEAGHCRNFQAYLEAHADQTLVDGYRQELDLRQNLGAADNIARALILSHEGGVLVGRNLLPQFDGGFLKALLIELQKNGLVLDAALAERLQGQTGIDAAVLPKHLFKFITDQVVIQQSKQRGDLLYTYPSRRPPELQLRDDATTKDVVEMFEAAIEKVAGERRELAGSGIFQRLGERANGLGLNLERTDSGATAPSVRNDDVFNDQLVEVREGSVAAERLYTRVQEVYHLLADPLIRATIEQLGVKRAAAIGQILDLAEREVGLLDDVEKRWSEVSDAPLPNMLFADLLDYLIQPRKDVNGTGSYFSGLYLLDLAKDYIDDMVSRGVPRAQAIESLIAGRINDAGAEAVSAHRLGKQAWAAVLQKRLPQVAALWAPPELPSEHAEHTSDDAMQAGSHASFNYDTQLIIQIDGDEVVRQAAQRLYGKQPDQSVFFNG